MCLTFVFVQVVVVAIYFILTAEEEEIISPAIAGVLLSFAIRLSDEFTWFMKEFNALEMDMVHVERVFEYIDREPECSGDTSVVSRYGGIEFRNIKFKYKEEGEVVLGTNGSGFSLNINPHERVGIVGRTGSGKSTILKALLRFRDVSSGEVLIDQCNVNNMTTDTLRSQISCVSQEALLFSASIRKNLDPTQTIDDTEMWAVLKTVALEEKIQGISGKLDHELDGDSEAFSQGEKQLFSLARALLRKASVLLLDEATASIDVATDDIVQAAIRKVKDVTIITIAHRVSTIMDYDKVAVLSAGKLLEFGDPKVLISDSASAFAKLANSH